MSTATVEDKMAARFHRDTANHQMTVLHDDGTYRHLRFMDPETSCYWFEVITWPGALAIRGDVDGLMFARTTDMFEFFRGKHINPGYWAEKTPDYGTSLQEYSQDVFVEAVTEALKDFADEDPALAQTVKAEIVVAVSNGDACHEQDARELLSFWEGKGVFSDTWEWDLTDWKWSYLWSCHAIVWAIAQYDASKGGEPR